MGGEMKCPKCGVGHTVKECKPVDGHTDGKRYLICPMSDGGCGHHWEMSKAEARAVAPAKRA